MSNKENDEADVVSLPVFERIDRICLDFEAAQKNGDCPKIEECLGDKTGSERRRLFRELLCVELEYRAGKGESPLRDDYYPRFPEERSIIDAVFASPTRTIEYPAREDSHPDQIGPYKIL